MNRRITRPLRRSPLRVPLAGRVLGLCVLSAGILLGPVACKGGPDAEDVLDAGLILSGQEIEGAGEGRKEGWKGGDAPPGLEKKPGDMPPGLYKKQHGGKPGKSGK